MLFELILLVATVALVSGESHIAIDTIQAKALNGPCHSIRLFPPEEPLRKRFDYFEICSFMLQCSSSRLVYTFLQCYIFSSMLSVGPDVDLVHYYHFRK